MALPAFLVGIVIQVIAYMRREKTPLGAQTEKKLWQSYLIVLLVTMAITPFTLDFDQKRLTTMPFQKITMQFPLMTH